MKARFSLAISLLVAFAIFSNTPMHGQGTDLGTIRGTVADASGAVVGQAAVTVTDTSTGATRQTKTNADGAYEMFGLRSGTYKVAVQASGFAPQEITGVVVTGSSVVGVNVALRVSSATEKIEVTGAAAEINTEDATISNSIGSQAVIDLPRDSRDIYDFLYLNPNITQADEPGDFKFIGFQSYGASFSLDGQRSNGGIFGAQTASEPSLEAVGELNVLSNNFSADYAGISNIRITTKRGTNQFHGSMFYNNKNSALGAWTVQDKIAQSEFSPSAFQSKFPTPFYNINDLGGSVGGPIPKLHNTWFFLAYERDYNVSPVDISSSTLAHPDLYTGNFSQMNLSALPDVPAGLGLTAQEIANDTVTDGSGHLLFTQIPSRLLNPTTQKLVSLYFPHIGLGVPISPTTGRIAGGYQTIQSGRDTLDLGTLRLDHDFSDRDHAYITYNASADTSANSPVVSPYTGLGLTQNNRQNNTVGLSYTHVFRPNLVNEVRGGFNKENLLRRSNTTLEGFLSSIGFDSSDIASYGSVVTPFALSTYGHPAINFNGAFATFSNGGRNTDRPMSQALTTFGDTLNWVSGKHDFKFGGDAVRNWAIDGFAWNRGNPRGTMTYKGPPDGCESGTCANHKVDSFADFLLGLPPTTGGYVYQLRPPMDVYNWEQGYFVQDDWKIHPHLTINLGLRYDLFSPFIDKNDLMANFDPNLINPNTGQPGVFVIPSTKTLQYLEPQIVNYGYLLASQTHQGIGRGLVKMDTNNFAPRIGFAWAIGDKSVLRGGYGIFYPTSAAQGIRDPIATNAFNQGVTVAGAIPGTALPNGWPGFAHGFSPISGGTPAAFGNQPSANAVPVGLQSPRIQQYSATFERQVGWDSALRLSYIGSHMGGLIAGRDLDEIPPNNSGFATTTGDGVTPCDPINNGDCAFSTADLARFRFPIIGGNLLTYGNFGRGNTNALQAQLEHRYKKGLMLSASYTYLEQKSNIGDTANSSLGSVPYDQFDLNRDYGIDNFVSRHRFVFYGIYDLPVGRGRSYAGGISRWMDAIIGGWQTSFNMFAKSGLTYTPFWTCDDCDPVFPGNIAGGSTDAVGDFNFPDFRPNVVSNQINTGKGGSGATIFNVNAFAPPSVGSDLFTNPGDPRRGMLIGPGMWGVNIGLHKNFQITERVIASLGADFDNIFNHPLLAPDFNDGGGGGSFANVGDFNLGVSQAAPPAGQQPSLFPITAQNPLCPFSNAAGNPTCFEYNPLFGQLIKSYPTEGVSASREVRLRLRITF